MKINNFDTSNAQDAIKFLLRHEETSQFMLSNYRAHGPKLTEHPNSGNFYCLQDGKTVLGVFVLTRRGILLGTTEKSQFSDDIAKFVVNSPINLVSANGEWNLMSQVWDKLLSLNPTIKPGNISKETLYRYQLTAQDTKIKSSEKVRFLNFNDYVQWKMVRQAYMEELGMQEGLTKDERRRQFKTTCDHRHWWGLFDGTVLTSIVGLNASTENVGQVGGMFTILKSRQRGMAKETMLHLMKDARDIHKLNRLILFTGDDNFGAQVLYQHLGFKEVGYYGLFQSAIEPTDV